METMVASLKFNSDGLIPVVVQDAHDGKVLMVAYMNKESLGLTLKTKLATYWSRSRQKLWKKGETSGKVQEVLSIQTDCDKDTLLLKIEQVGGAACHTGNRSCFYIEATDQGWKENSQPLFDPEKVYKK